MSAEPRPTIGDQLRTFARQRRDAANAPFEPHPLTRKVLQDEVARTFSARTVARQTTPPKWLAAFWMRSALAGGLLALLVVAAIFWLPKDTQPKTQLARHENRAVTAQAPSSAPQPATPAALEGPGAGVPAPREAAPLPRQTEAVVDRYSSVPQSSVGPNLASAKSEAFQAAQETENRAVVAENLPRLALERDNSVSTSSPVVLALAGKQSLDEQVAPLASEPSSEARLKSENEVPKPSQGPDISTQTGRGQAGQLLQPPEAGPPSIAQHRSESEFMPGAAATNVFFFSRPDSRAKYRRNFNSPPVPQVLRSFQLVQSGAKVRVIDEDGSIYEGVVGRPAAGSSPPGHLKNAGVEVLRARAHTAAEGDVRPAGNVTFTAVGTNRSVNQLVTVTGELRSDVPQIGIVRDRGAGRTGPGAPVTLQGKVAIGRRVEIPIEATGTLR